MEPTEQINSIKVQMRTGLYKEKFRLIHHPQDAPVVYRELVRAARVIDAHKYLDVVMSEDVTPGTVKLQDKQVEDPALNDLMNETSAWSRNFHGRI